MKKLLISITIVLILGTLVFFILPTKYSISFDFTKQTKNQKAEFAEPLRKDEAPSLTSQTKLPVETSLLFAGDINTDRGVRGMVNKYFNGDLNQIFMNARSLISGADIAFANLEGPVSDVGNKVGSIYSFRMPTETIPILKDVGFDIVSFANNHVGDWNQKAFDDTIKRLDASKIKFTGAGTNYDDAKTVRIIEKNGIKFGFVGFSDVGPDWMKADEINPGILIASDKNRMQIISDAKKLCDILIVSYHAGEEYKPHNKRQSELFKSSVDAGADIVVGHHPHVAQDIEIYKDKPIFYSLGNFMFDQYFSPETLQGLVVKVYLKDGKLDHLEQYTSYQNKKYQIEKIEFNKNIQL